MSIAATVLRVLSTITGALLPKGKQLYAERSAGKVPESVPIDTAEEILDEALNRLGAVDVDQPWWKDALVEVGATAIRPDWFKKPHVQEWLSQADVRRLLKLVAKDNLTGAKVNWENHEALVASYMENAGEDRQYAESIISLATAVLKASIMGAVHDPGTAAIVQATATDHRKLLVAIDEKLNSIESRNSDKLAEPAVSNETFQRGAASEIFESISPEDRTATSVHLAFSTFGVTLDTDTDALICTSVCIVTDAPDRLRRQLLQIQVVIQNNPLVSMAAKNRARGQSLQKLLDDPGTRALVLRELEVMSFSAYMYYCPKEIFNKLLPEEKVCKLIVAPLAHRLGKKGEHFEQVHARQVGMSTYIKNAADAVHSDYHRVIDVPQPGANRYAVLEEFAALIARACALHLSAPENVDATTLFESLRTRVRYAENVATGAKHKRDVNPLP